MIDNKALWELHFGTKKEAIDFAGRKIKIGDYGKNSDFSWEIDHAIPVSMGGTDAYFNLLPVHRVSNDLKKDLISWTDGGKRYQIKSFKTLRCEYPALLGKGYGYCLLKEDDNCEVIAFTKAK